MARKAIYNYIFSPGAANSGYVVIPDAYKLGDILMITNVTRNTVIYNFGDPSRGGTVTFTNSPNVTDLSPTASGGVAAGTPIFSNLNNGYTKVTFAYATNSPVAMAATDVLQIYVETTELKVRPYDFGVDAVERMKVAAPQSLIDADFEYGPQPTKWVSFATVNDQPMGFELPGTDIALTTQSYATFVSPGATINTPTTTAFGIQNQGFDAAAQTPQNGPRWIQNSYSLLISQGQYGQPNTAAGTTNITNVLPIAPQFGGAAQRTFTVGNTAGYAAGDIICAVEMPGEGFAVVAGATGITGNAVVATVITTALAAGVTALAANNTALSANAIILVETTQFGIWEAMGITAGGGSAAVTVLRNLWGTNGANASIPIGARIRQLSGNIGVPGTPGAAYFSNANVETMRVDSVDNNNQFTVTRGWFNVNASPTFGANSIVFRVNHNAFGAATGRMDAGNLEIVRTTIAGSNIYGAPLGNIVVQRGALGTTPLYNAGAGSLLIQLTGAFIAGNTSVPAVTLYAPNHGLGQFSNSNIANAFVSTIGFSQAVTVSNIEGVFVNQTNDQHYIKYFPKVNANQLPGAQLNLNDAQTVIRRAGTYTGANIVVANVVSNIGSPSLVTVTTVYPHGLVAGVAIQAQVYNGTVTQEAASGQFVVTSTPTPTTLTYVAKPNLVVQTTGISSLWGNITLFSQGLVKHRPLDGGNNIGVNTPGHGYEQTRQTKKYFRYQSGKGTMFTTGTQFNPVFTMANIVAAGTTIGSAITIVTENEHGVQVGANVLIYGVSTTGYNDYYTVASVIQNNQLTVLAKSALGSVQPTWGYSNAITNAKYAGQNYPRLAIINWHGAKIRAGIFDDGNGVFYEFDGQQLYAVKRNSTMDLAGRVSMATGSNYVIGDPNTRFLDQLSTGDQVVIRGMSHTVNQVIDQTHMYVTPAYRGVVNAADVRIATVKEERTPQKYFNLDRADGTGPSGYVMNLNKMQMVGIQFTWYGAGFVDYMVRGIEGRMHTLHRSKGNNMNDEAYMRTGNLPARYQATNRGARTWLSTPLPASETTEIKLYDVSEFPNVTAIGSGTVTVMIDNEFINYTKGPFLANGNIAGITRGATLSTFALGATQPKYAGSNAGTTNFTSAGLPSASVWSSMVQNPITGLWVAISGYYGAGAFFSQATAISVDGISWVAGANMPSGALWISVAYGQFGGVDYWVAVAAGSGTTAAYSTNPLAGGTWNASTLPATATWSSVAYGFTATNAPVFVAVSGALGQAAGTATAYSTNGTTWTAGGSLASANYTSIAFGRVNAANSTTVGIAGRGNYFVAVNGSTGATTLYWSSDGGQNWTQVTGLTAGTYISVAFGNNSWIAITGGVNGVGTLNTTATIIAVGAPLTWTAGSTMPAAGAAAAWRAVTYSPYPGSTNGQFACIADNSSQAAYISALLLSGSTFTATTLPLAAAAWSTIAAGNGQFVALTANSAAFGVAQSGQLGYNHVISVDGGVSYFTTQLPSSTLTTAWGPAAYGAGNVVALQTGGTTVGLSFNAGRLWKVGAALASTSNWSSVAYGPSQGVGGQGRFVAVSATSGTVNNWQDATNLGSTWIAGGALGSTAVWQSVTFVNGAFVAVANTASTAATYSTTGATSWYAITLPSASNWSSVAGGQVTATGAYYAVTVSATTGQINAFSAVTSIGGNVTMNNFTAGSTTGFPSASWTSIAYGNPVSPAPTNPITDKAPVGYWVAVAGSGAGTGGQTAWTKDPTGVWTTGGTLPGILSSGTSYNNQISFGANGVWVVVGSVAGTKATAAAYSINNGISWTAITLPISAYWTSALFAKEHNSWVALSGDATNFTANTAVSLTTGGLAQPHTANTGVRVVSVTATPDLNHWGSAIIMDGGFTADRTYTFTYNVTNFQLQANAAPQTVFMMRLAPSLSNAITGELGVKDLINRAQVLLQNMFMNIGNPGARYLLQGILNPSNLLNAQFRPLNAPQTSLQPSFAQFVANTQGLSLSNLASTTTPLSITYQSVSNLAAILSTVTTVTGITTPGTAANTALVTLQDTSSIRYIYPGLILTAGTGATSPGGGTAVFNNGTALAGGGVFVANIVSPTQFWIVDNRVTNNTGTVWATAGTFNIAVGYTAAFGGEQVFSIPVTQTNSGFLDLSQIKEITGMVLPGTGTYPNGNEILAINMVPINPAAGNGNCDVQITYTESQA
jgi:hypothetical protein